jgi:FAD/FMN-containing dehydrogenase
LENSELFSLVIGGYGLFGVVLSADIQLAEDDVYKKSCKTLDDRAYPAYFEANVANQREVGLHYARLRFVTAICCVPPWLVRLPRRQSGQRESSDSSKK